MDDLHLSISDDGAGFNVKDALGKQGIGMFSMEERARLIGAQFRIHSDARSGNPDRYLGADTVKQAPAKPADEVVMRSRCPVA